MKTLRFGFTLCAMAIMLLSFQSIEASAQKREKIAVVGMDIKNINVDMPTMVNMMLLELEKINLYEVLDKYDVADKLKQQGFNTEGCFGKNCQVSAGKIVNADFMLTGSMERFGNKIIFILRLVDVKAEAVVKSDVMEYLDQQDYLQTMLRLSLNNLFGAENDRHLVDLLVNYDQPITSIRTTLRLDGPRVGATYFWGSYADRMQAPTSEGGFNMYPASVMIGYQFERRFLSAGDFQALFEVIPTIIGMESGLIIPSLPMMLGFRFNQSGIEFGLGPVLRMVRTAEGYYDGNGKWNLLSAADSVGVPFPIVKTIDSRGAFGLSYGMIFAVGKTFRSGYLNMPVNLYYSPRKEGSVLGLTMGFNVANRPRLQPK